MQLNANDGKHLAKLKSVLIDRRDELTRMLNGELAQLGGHDEDDDEWFEDGTGSKLAESESDELEAIDQALDRMRQGVFGVCQECGHKIAIERLEALPHAATCIRCQKKLEG